MSAINRTAAITGVNIDALERLVYNESRGNINVGMDKSNYSAGIGQVSRTVWNKYSSLPYNVAAKPEYYEENLLVAAKYLKENYNRFGNWRLALAAYNQGPTALKQVLAGKRQLAPITRKYIEGFNQ